MYIAVVIFRDDPWDIRVYGPYVRQKSAIAKANKLDEHFSHTGQHYSVGYHKLRKN